MHTLWDEMRVINYAHYTNTLKSEGKITHQLQTSSAVSNPTTFTVVAIGQVSTINVVAEQNSWLQGASIDFVRVVPGVVSVL